MEVSFPQLQASDLFPYIHVRHLYHTLKETYHLIVESDNFVEEINSFVLYILCCLCVIALL
jgi:hypothetical protein